MDEINISPFGDGYESYISEFAPLSITHPTLIGSFSNLTSTSVTLHGTIINTGGAPITARGFWIRRAVESDHQERLVFTSTNSFSLQIGGLQPNTQYVARAIARNSGMSFGSGQSPQIFNSLLYQPNQHQCYTSWNYH